MKGPLNIPVSSTDIRNAFKGTDKKHFAKVTHKAYKFVKGKPDYEYYILEKHLKEGGDATRPISDR